MLTNIFLLCVIILMNQNRTAIAEIDPSAKIGNSVKIIKPVKIGKNTVIGERSSIGPNVTIGNGVTVLDDVTMVNDVFIADNVFISAQVVLENNVFVYAGGYIGYHADLRNSTVSIGARVEQFVELIGTQVSNDVCIGVDTTIINTIFERRTNIGETVYIDDRVFIGDFVTIKNNTYIGKNSIIKSDAFIDEAVYIGENVTVSNRSTVRKYSFIYDNIQIGDDFVVEIYNLLVRPPTTLNLLNFVKLSKPWKCTMNQKEIVKSSSEVFNIALLVKLVTGSSNIVEICDRLSKWEHVISFIAQQIGCVASMYLERNYGSEKVENWLNSTANADSDELNEEHFSDRKKNNIELSTRAKKEFFKMLLFYYETTRSGDSFLLGLRGYCVGINKIREDEYVIRVV